MYSFHLVGQKIDMILTRALLSVSWMFGTLINIKIKSQHIWKRNSPEVICAKSIMYMTLWITYYWSHCMWWCDRYAMWYMILINCVSVALCRCHHTIMQHVCLCIIWIVLFKAIRDWIRSYWDVDIMWLYIRIAFHFIPLLHNWNMYTFIHMYEWCFVWFILS